MARGWCEKCGVGLGLHDFVMNRQIQYKQRHFVLTQVRQEDCIDLFSIHTQLNELALSYWPYEDFHLTLLYFEPEGLSPNAIIDHFKAKIDLLQSFNLAINEVHVERGQIWASMIKDKTLQDIHYAITGLMPKHFGGENLSFEEWNPHIMIARRLPPILEENKARKLKKYLEQTHTRKILNFDRFYLTKQNPNSFEILYDR